MQKQISRNKRKIRIGIVKNNKMNKTITVVVDKVSHHPVYDRLIRSKVVFKAHDEKNEAKIGDTVKREETRPISKTKRWRLVEVIKKL
jgi:small subunit ribosomal protein S17